MTVRRRPTLAIRDERAFEQALSSAARSLVMAPLPRALLDTPSPRAARPWLDLGRPLGAVAALATLVLVVGLNIGALGGRVANPGSPARDGTPFRSGTQITYDLRGLGFICRSGAAGDAGQPRMDAIVCTRDASSMSTTVILSEDAAGQTGEIHVRLAVQGTLTTPDARWDLLRQASALPFADPSNAEALRGWLDGALPIGPNELRSTRIGGSPVALQRDDLGEYVVVVGDLGADIGVTPSG